jgi:alkanesulfonate monooxygenase SsuD/methylene tetrahydromethanopterin reductase-like flavin-dependent oxidoreductase (luciferase family)
LAAGAYAPDDARHYLGKMRAYRKEAGRASDPFAIYLTLAALPDVDLYREFEEAGVTDMVCAPWMLAGGVDSTLDAKLAATEEFATTIIAKM